jgi:phosphotriesterase-related protein
LKRSGTACPCRLAQSHDVCTRTQLRRNGGAGYAHLLTVIAPGLSRRDHGPESLRLVLDETPRRLLAWA